jgi:hypothetical protein
LVVARSIGALFRTPVAVGVALRTSVKDSRLTLADSLQNTVAADILMVQKIARCSHKMAYTCQHDVSCHRKMRWAADLLPFRVSSIKIFHAHTWISWN